LDVLHFIGVKRGSWFAKTAPNPDSMAGGDGNIPRHLFHPAGQNRPEFEIPFPRPFTLDPFIFYCAPLTGNYMQTDFKKIANGMS